uniref:Mitochondrial thiamine pyrophosphate carrier n=1 Tax=Loa loa TaxID=7209 RepID=A0A1I7VGF1_LOALO
MIGYGTQELTSIEYSAAGLITGIATRFLIQPLDVLKIRFQVQREPTFGKTKGQYHGIFQACSRIYEDEGLVAFWKGHVPAQGLSAIYGIVQFAIFEFLTEQAVRCPLANENRRVTDIICGALAGCGGTAFSLPFDVIRTRLIIQAQHKVHSHGLVFRSNRIVQNLKTRVLHVIFEIIGLQFSLYNVLSVSWERLPDYLESFGPLCCGALAGVISKTVVYPLDVFRHRLQAHGFGCFKQLPWHSMRSTTAAILRDEKVTGLFKGLWPSQLKAACSSGLAFMFYEICLKVMRDLKSP